MLYIATGLVCLTISTLLWFFGKLTYHVPLFLLSVMVSYDHHLQSISSAMSENQSQENMHRHTIRLLDNARLKFDEAIGHVQKIQLAYNRIAIFIGAFQITFAATGIYLIIKGVRSLVW